MSARIADKYKSRVILDTGSTTTVVSKALLKQMPEVLKLCQPTALTYSGVDAGSKSYDSIIPNLQLQLTPDITIEVIAGVVETNDPYFIIGQDVLGGAKCRLRTIGYNTDYSILTVVDTVTGKIGNLHYLKNVEITGFPKTGYHTATAANASINRV